MNKPTMAMENVLRIFAAFCFVAAVFPFMVMFSAPAQTRLYLLILAVTSALSGIGLLWMQQVLQWLRTIAMMSHRPQSPEVQMLTPDEPSSLPETKWVVKGRRGKDFVRTEVTARGRDRAVEMAMERGMTVVESAVPA